MPSSPTNSFSEPAQMNVQVHSCWILLLGLLGDFNGTLDKVRQRFAPAHFVDPFFHVFRAARFEVLAEIKFSSASCVSL